MKDLAFVGELFRKFPRLLTLSTLLVLGEGLIGSVAIVSIAPVIDLFVSGDLQKASSITRLAAGMMQSLGLPVSLGSFLIVSVLFQCLKSGFTIVARYCLLRTKYAVLRHLMLGTFEDFFHARWIFFSSHEQGTMLNTFTREMAIVGDAFGAMALFFASALQLSCYLAVPLFLSWQVTSLSLATGLLFALPLLLLGKATYRLGKLNTSTANAVSTVLQEHLSMAKVVLGFGNQRTGLGHLARAFDSHRRVTLKSQTLLAATPLMYEPVGVLVLFVALLAAQSFTMPLSEIAVLLWALRSCVPLIGALTVQKNSLASFFPSYEQITHLRQRAKSLRQYSGHLPFRGFERGVEIESLTFGYPGHEPILVDINLRIPKGTLVALVGESGAGKSTLLDAVMGFHEPATGRIMIDGVLLQQFDINSYRRRIGYVPQESVLFNASIRDNLLWANEAATETDIREACRQANADEFIRSFPEGYETVVGDRGVRLSGGQVQRVALARAILRRPELLILDEATSALDSHSERLIQRAMERIAHHTTLIVIAHRLSTIVNADYIYVLKQGRIIEEGTYAELIRQEGELARMAQLQALHRGDGEVMATSAHPPGDATVPAGP